MCAAGPPKLMTPSLEKARSNSIRRAGEVPSCIGSCCGAAGSVVRNASIYTALREPACAALSRGASPEIEVRDDELAAEWRAYGIRSRPTSFHPPSRLKYTWMGTPHEALGGWTARISSLM